jgi:hypothetical protein
MDKNKNTMKKCSTSLAIKEMQIKTISRFYLLLLEWLPSITQTTKSAGEDVGEKKHFHTVGGNVKSCNCYGKQYGSPSKN